MKRSEINASISWAKELLAQNNIELPALAYWSLAELKERKAQLATVRKLELGWDITDFGSNDFARVGAVLYTVRNGLADDPSVGVPYCEKYIVMRDGQHLPNHYHVFKSEDIINRHDADGWKVNGAGGDGGSVTILSNGDVKAQRDMLREINSLGGGIREIGIRLDDAGLRVIHG